MIEQSLKNRAHVTEYSNEKIPTLDEITQILQTGYSLVTSKQKSYPYKVHVLGPDAVRSKNIWRMAEGDKIRIDEEAYGDAGKDYRENPGLYHLATAPWTLIYTPRVAPPNPFHRKAFDDSNSLWQLEDPEYVNRCGQRESTALEVGMLAKVITGLALEKGYDSSYNICFRRDSVKSWEHICRLDYIPSLIQTIGVGKVYLWQTLTEENRKGNFDPPFGDIFEFIDEARL